MPDPTPGTEPGTVAVVPLEGRGLLPFADLHGQPLLLHALRAVLAVRRPGDSAQEPPVESPGESPGKSPRESPGDRVVLTVDPDQHVAAVAALERSGLQAEVRDARSWWRLEGPVTVLLHDPLCPLVPPTFLARCLADGPTLAAFRPVTDTVKTVVADRITGTVDRDAYGVVTSPVVFDHRRSDGPPPTADVAALVAWLRARGPVRLARAPSLGRRVDDPSAVELLECLDEVAATGQRG